MPPSSWILTVTVAEPFASGADVYVNVPDGLTAGWVVNSALLSLPTMKSTDWPDSFAGPFEIEVAHGATVCAPLSSFTVWSPPFVKLGASLTESTVIVNVRVLLSTPPLAVPPLSVTVTVIVAVPCWLATGVYFSEPPAFGLV